MMIFFKGFHSGPKRLEGGYVQTFHGTGTLTYASDSVIGEDSDAKLTGSIVVSVPGMDDNSYSEDLDIKICTSCKYYFDVRKHYEVTMSGALMANYYISWRLKNNVMSSKYLVMRALHDH